MSSTLESPKKKQSESKPSDAEVTTEIKKEHPGWVDDPIAGLSEVAQVFETKAGMISTVVVLSGIVAVIGSLFSAILLIGSLLDGDIIGGLLLFGVPLLVFLIILVNAIRSEGHIWPIANRLKSLSKALTFDPAPQIPEGRDSVDRFLNYLQVSDDRFSKSLAKVPRELKLGVRLKGKSGKSYVFDAFMHDKGGWKRSRYLMTIKLFPHRVSVSDLEAYKKQLEDVFEKIRRLPTRIFVIQNEGELDEEAIEYAESEWVVWESQNAPHAMIIRGRRYGGVPIEIVRETEEGTYDFGIFYFG